MDNTFIINEDTLNEVGEVMRPSETKFNENMRYFFHQLKDDPVHAEVPTCIRMAGISRSRFLKMLQDRGIIVRTEKLNDKDKDGNFKKPTMTVKYNILDKIPDELEFKVSKTDFDRRIEKLRRSIFEKNLPKKKQPVQEQIFNTPLGDAIACAKNDPATIGFIAPPEKPHDANSWLMNRAVEAWNGELEKRKKKEQPIDEEGGGATGCCGVTDGSNTVLTPMIKGVVRRKLEEAISADSRYRFLGGGFDITTEDGAMEQSLVTIQNKQTGTLYHICFDGANFSVYRDMRDGTPATHVSYVIDNLFDALQSNGNVVMNESTDEMTAMHSSRAKFDNFDGSFIGSGCGSQAYGWGHYVSTDKKVNRGYDEFFRTHPQHIEGTTKDGSYTYKVDIPDDNGSNYIPWDGPALPNLPFSDEPTFGEQYQRMAMQSTDKNVSMKLASMGYVGIKVAAFRNQTKKDGGDYQNDLKKPNYVVFNGEDIKILKTKEHTKKAKNYGGFYYSKNAMTNNEGESLFQEWNGVKPFITKIYSGNYFRIFYDNGQFHKENIFAKNLKLVWPDENPETWPTQIQMTKFKFFIYYSGFELWPVMVGTTTPLFGNIKSETGYANQYEFDYEKECYVFSFPLDNKDVEHIYIGKDCKPYTDEKTYKRKSMPLLTKVRNALNKPVFSLEENNGGRVFNITEEQLRQIEEATGTTQVGAGKDGNTGYQYAVPFTGVDSDDPTMQRHNGKFGSVSIPQQS